MYEPLYCRGMTTARKPVAGTGALSKTDVNNAGKGSWRVTKRRVNGRKKGTWHAERPTRVIKCTHCDLLVCQRNSIVSTAKTVMNPTWCLSPGFGKASA